MRLHAASSGQVRAWRPRGDLVEIAGRSSSDGLNAGSGSSANESSDLPACVALVDLPQSGPLFVGAEVGAVGASWVAGHHPGVLLVGSAITRPRRAVARPNRADLSLIDGSAASCLSVARSAARIDLLPWYCSASAVSMNSSSSDIRHRYVAHRDRARSPRRRRPGLDTSRSTMNDEPRSGCDRTRCGPVDQIISLHSLSCSSS